MRPMEKLGRSMAGWIPEEEKQIPFGDDNKKRVDDKKKRVDDNKKRF